MSAFPEQKQRTKPQITRIAEALARSEKTGPTPYASFLEDYGVWDPKAAKINAQNLSLEKLEHQRRQANADLARSLHLAPKTFSSDIYLHLLASQNHITIQTLPKSGRIIEGRKITRILPRTGTYPLVFYDAYEPLPDNPSPTSFEIIPLPAYYKWFANRRPNLTFDPPLPSRGDNSRDSEKTPSL